MMNHEGMRTMICRLVWLPLLLMIAVGCETGGGEKVKPLPQPIRFTSPGGKPYTLLATTEKNAWTPAVHGDKKGEREVFIGKGRELAKLTPANAPLEVYRNLFTVIESLPSEQEMLTRVPPIEMGREAPRVREEQGQVQVKAWIYAVLREKDNGYRLILGSYPTREGSSYLSAIVSGLPEGGPNRATLEAVRQKFLAFFGNTPPSGEHYQLLAPAVPVLVTGSLFYSMDHPPSAIGPEGFKPGTNWELRPITDLVMEAK